MNINKLRKDEIKDMKVLATGYKIFDADYVHCDGYDFKDENGNVIGTIHKTNDKSSKYNLGLDFSENPLNCLKDYISLRRDKFTKVNAYGKVLKGTQKTVAEIIEIVETYTFDEFVSLVKNYLTTPKKGFQWGNCVYGENEVYDSNDIYGGNCVINAHEIYGGNSVIDSNYSSGVNNISNSKGIYGGNRIRNCDGISGGSEVYGSTGIDGGSRVYYSLDCEGVSRCIFCHNVSGKLLVFNKPVTKKRFVTIEQDLEKFGWYPNFYVDNEKELDDELEFEEEMFDDTIAYSTMPQEMLEYIKKMPEYDEEIFNKITGKLDESKNKQF